MITSPRTTAFRSLIASAFLGVLASSFSTVSAADPNSASVTVKYSDLNIASPSGALKLYARIESASHAACSYFWFKTDADESRCLRNAIAKAVTQVNQPALSAIHDARVKAPVPSILVSQSR